MNSVEKSIKERYFMWSFDEENKNESPSENGGTGENNNGYGGDNYGYNGNNPYGGGYNNPYGSSNGGNKNNNNNKKSGLIPALLLCAVVVLGTLLIGYTLGGGKIALGGYGAQTTTTDSAGTTVSDTSTSQMDTTTEQKETTAATTVTAPAVTGAISSATEGKIESVAEKCLNASVLIKVTTSTGSGSGSGVIYTKDGYILTNYHVVGDDAQSVTVTLFSGEELPAKYIYGDESLDVSVIKIEKDDCSPVEICEDGLNYGEQIIVVGNALGNGFTLTSGYVSAPEREVTFSNTYETMTFVQIDAAVNNGNSGGGLFNAKGELIGIVNAKSVGENVEGLGFAIPISDAVRIMTDLVEKGYVAGRVKLGFELFEVQTQEDIRHWFKYSRYFTDYGVYIASSENKSFHEGDLLVAINSVKIASISDLKALLQDFKVGQTVTVTVSRIVGNKVQIFDYQLTLTEKK